MTLYISPTEPEPIRKLGRTSSLPERYGVDVLFAVNSKLCGIQRKRIDDLVASLRDGRMAKELGQMQALALAVVLIEGYPRWSNDGRLLDNPSLTRAGWWGLQFSIQLQHRIAVLQVASMEETLEAIKRFEAWASKRQHDSLARRPKAQGAWGTPTHREWALHMLQGLPGVGPQLAGAIYEALGLPIGWTCSKEELGKVPGIGKKRVEELWRALKPKAG